MHSFEVSLGYESVDRTTFFNIRFIENVLQSTLSYPNKTSKECIQFLNMVDSWFIVALTTRSKLSICNCAKHVKNYNEKHKYHTITTVPNSNRNIIET